ncbi:DDHD domain-containing protein [Gigaspora rosea]|uniref:DDHD domain-containing protein n=1 Tax=Gigaspora rosea TaxID=44941 RepID=A0A397VD42_9GLOM|nr:DDHD domain-containing protein [Gigaspora rosea]
MGLDNLDYPPLPVRWFHAVDVPSWDPLKTPKLSNNSKTSPIEEKCPMVWVPFSKRDSNALETAYKLGVPGQKVCCNEDYLFEVDLDNREISPIYWVDAIYQVVRATWFYQGDGNSFIPCDEYLSVQIEEGYIKHKAWIPASNSNDENNGEKNWFLTDKYKGQYIVYTSPSVAWLIIDDLTGKFTKTIFSKFTKGEHLGGIRLLRGYPEVEKYVSNKKIVEPENKKEKSNVKNGKESTDGKGSNDQEQDIDYVKSEEDDERVIDHLIFCIHGIGQKLSERDGSASFINEINKFRQTLKKIYATNPPPEATAKLEDRNLYPDYGLRHSKKGSQLGNGVQVIPIHWRQDIKFGIASEDEQIQRDLSLAISEEGQPTLDEVTIEGIPNLRMLISDALVDVLLYMTPKFRKMMLTTVTNEMNRVFNLFIDRNPKFLKIGGKVSLYGHSLGSLLAFDVLCHQPPIIGPFGEVFEENLPSLSLSEISNPLYRLQDSNIADSQERFDHSGNATKSSVDLNSKHTSSTSHHDVDDYDHHDRYRNNGYIDRQMYRRKPKQLNITLDFEVENLYAVGSPIGLFLLLKGLKIASREYYNAIRKVYQLKNWSDISLGNESDDVRNGDEHLKDGKDNEKLENEGNDDKKDLNEENEQNKKMSRKDLSIGNKDAEDLMMLMQDSVTLIPLCYPACRSVYNIFHKADPIAFRIEPLVARHYSKTLKPALVPYHKGGLKAMQLGFQEFGSNISKTTSNILRSLSLSKPPDESANKRKNNKQAREKHFIERELLKRKQLQKLYSEAGSSVNLMNCGDTVNSSRSSLVSVSSDGRTSIDTERRFSVDTSYISDEASERRYSVDSNFVYKESPRGLSVEAREKFYMSQVELSSTSPTTNEKKEQFYQVKTSSSPVVNEDGELDYKTNGEAKLKSLNKSGRIDYCLQQGILDVGYISAITDHLNYWTDGDASYFILRETYKNYDDDD